MLLNIYRSGFKAKDSAECKQKHCAHASAKVLLPSDVNILSTLQMFVRHLLSLSQCTPLYRYFSSVNPPSLKGFHHFHGSFLFLALTFLLFCLFLFTSLLSLKTSLLLLPSKNVFISSSSSYLCLLFLLERNKRRRDIVSVMCPGSARGLHQVGHAQNISNGKWTGSLYNSFLLYPSTQSTLYIIPHSPINTSTFVCLSAFCLTCLTRTDISIDASEGATWS